MAIVVRIHKNSEPVENKNRVSKDLSTSIIVQLVWVLTVMIWPLLRWVLALDVTLQLFRVFILSMHKGWYVDWILIEHFMFFVALTYFVSVYKPR